LIRRIVAFDRLLRFIRVQRRGRVGGYGEEGDPARRLGCEMPLYDEARLARLLRLLRAAPLEWVRRAQRIPLKAVPLSAGDLEVLAGKLEREPAFQQEFDADPVAALRSVGMGDLGSRLEYEIGELIALAEHVARDAERREELVAALDAGSSASVLALLSVSEVEAHAIVPPLEQQALLLALASAAVADGIRAAVED
jgi:hypothetical protein